MFHRGGARVETFDPQPESPHHDPRVPGGSGGGGLNGSVASAGERGERGGRDSGDDFLEGGGPHPTIVVWGEGGGGDGGRR